MECAENNTAAGESLSELKSLKGKALEFLCKSGHEGRDAARGKPVLMLRAYLGHGQRFSKWIILAALTRSKALTAGLHASMSDSEPLIR
jgi:hypothetical protein